ncbi:PulJ/GspJ family protein [Lysinibacillus odysseyi]|uniref:Type II secretory pathway protein n=1 Tax=Lysinibacillus odysseyi 34hs-1 = NBRC 100172 TaxID=1220589 RepID=A0A0A3IJA7_9BACI|nr:type II secretion system protein [Lysinibacillus odysseyi]KGR84826.1 type II secretory pathway protein [Lysinibacillus odysseyi 34hs-1 = NBRC 100172]
MKIIKNENGISLIELVASIAIVSIVLISFAQLFIQANKASVHNNEKLVTINLADAALAKLQSETFTKKPAITNMNDYFIDTTEKDPIKKRPPLAIAMNEKTYMVSYKASQSDVSPSSGKIRYSEKSLNLIKVVVTVTAPDGKIKGSSEGYVSLE